MGPTILSSYTGNVAGSLNPTILNVNVPVGTVDPMILVFFEAANNAQPTAAVWNGENFTVMASVNTWFDRSLVLKPATTGSHTLTLTVPFFSNNGIISVWVLENAVGVSADVDVVGDSPNNTVATVTITTKSDNSLVAMYGAMISPFFSGAAPTITQGSGQTQQTTNNSGVSWMRQATSYKAVATKGTPTTMSMSSSMAAAQQSINAFEIFSVLPKTNAQGAFLLKMI